ncbi:GNAT family N-acetyltransferase [Paenibacillus herberti]|uniref:GNAT family N-acetyltransferase n=1 Tax=Paenibacillus herberti TaxID=1619309 RepID=A0A229P2I6_9BACL|nr:GNAT family N-acetyltransferase [Paenibacillus herberti]OXM16129.1 GNAT family N-acetyltransferase [Paenibacillus herberti]
MIEIYSLKDKTEDFERAVQLFWDQWGTENNFPFYHDCILHSMKTDSDLPSFFIAKMDESIIGTYALLRNDLISRQDLFPWLACLYVAPEYRGQGIGSKLLQHARQETGKKGYNNLYLSTDLNGYYEKYGWVHSSSGYIFTGDETKIYEASSIIN